MIKLLALLPNQVTSSPFIFKPPWRQSKYLVKPMLSSLRTSMAKALETRAAAYYDIGVILYIINRLADTLEK